MVYDQLYGRFDCWQAGFGIIKCDPKYIYILFNFESYSNNSTIVCEIFSEYNPNMRAYRLNEIYLDTGLYLSLLYCTALKLMWHVVVTIVSQYADWVSKREHCWLVRKYVQFVFWWEELCLHASVPGGVLLLNWRK